MMRNWERVPSDCVITLNLGISYNTKVMIPTPGFWYLTFCCRNKLSMIPVPSRILVHGGGGCMKAGINCALSFFQFLNHPILLRSH